MYILTKHLVLVFLCAFLFGSCAKDTELPEEDVAIKTANLVDYIAYSQLELDILSAINDYRISKGLSSLIRVDEITIEAKDHNLYMIENNVVNHNNFQQRYSNLVTEISAKAVSENVGYGYNSAEAVVEAWINSEGHRANLEGNYTHFGISVEQDEEGNNYFTNIFVRR